jgi:hypothetical protein
VGDGPSADQGSRDEQPSKGGTLGDLLKEKFGAKLGAMAQGGDALKSTES